ncbi:MAG: ABC transporter permease [Clostridia bacterium]
MRFTRISALAVRIIRQFLRDRRTLALVFLGPIAIMSLLAWLVNNPQPPVRLAILSDDPANSRLVEQLRTMAREDENISLVEATEDVEPLVREGSLDGAAILPHGFAGDLFLGKGPDLEVLVEGSDPQVTRSTLQVTANLLRGLADTVLGAQPLLGGDLTRSMPRIKTRYIYGGEDLTPVDYFAPMYIAGFVLFFVFLLTSVSFLRERAQGTMERVLASPLSRGEIILGYLAGSSVFAFVQSLVVLLFVVFVLKIHHIGSLYVIFAVELVLTIGSVNLGIFLSTFAKNELQVVQFIPLVIAPQMLLSGIFWRVETMPVVLRYVAYLMPLTYANQALRNVMIKGFGLWQLWPQFAALGGFALAMVGLSVLTLRRQAA